MNRKCKLKVLLNCIYKMKLISDKENKLTKWVLGRKSIFYDLGRYIIPGIILILKLKYIYLRINRIMVRHNLILCTYKWYTKIGK